MGIFKNIGKLIKSKLPFYNNDGIKIKTDSFRLYEDRSTYIAETCEQIIESLKKQEELKIEYEIVTFYLTDIQKIDRILEEERKELKELANKVYGLMKERKDYQGHVRKLSNRQYRALMENEERMPGVIKELKESEKYSQLIKGDMDLLEGERGSLFYEKEAIDNRQRLIYWIAKITSLWTLIVLGILILISLVYEINIESPVIVTSSIAAIILIIILYNIYINRKELFTLSPKIKKAIRILNSTKIKYVNNKNNLDYIYRKYMVRNSKELEFIWGQYREEKEKEIRYRRNTGKLDQYATDLIGILEKYDIEDTEIWIYQASALVDSKEMVEIRHSLNTRRQKIREELESYDNLIKANEGKLRALVEEFPESKEEVSGYLRKIGVNL